MSFPLEIVSTCVVVPTFIKHAWSPLLVNVIDSFGFSPAPYDVLSVTATTSTVELSHAPSVALADGVGAGWGDVGDDVGVGVTAGDTDEVADGAGGTGLEPEGPADAGTETPGVWLGFATGRAAFQGCHTTTATMTAAIRAITETTARRRRR